MKRDERTIFEKSYKGRIGYSLPAIDVTSETSLPKETCRAGAPELPELSETDVVRHFVNLSKLNYDKDGGFYPLGSCTMKYNPKVTEKVVSLPGFTSTHPYQPDSQLQGVLELIYNLEHSLAMISGMDAVTVIPAAGAHGELTGMLMVRAYHEAKGAVRKFVIIPDSAHGTNPASTALAGYDVLPVKSGPDGLLHPDTVRAVMTEEVAAIMITNPNTLGLFETHIKEIADIVHAKGGLVYMDGANLNAIMGKTRPGDFGIDVMHFNLHKTFATPHGGGGPGSGPVGVKNCLEPFLPAPRVVKNGTKFDLRTNMPHSIGHVKAGLGNFLVNVRAYAYIREMGGDGLKRVSEMAVLNACYIKARLKDYFDLPYDRPSLHECVFSDKIQSEYKIKTLDIAKRLMDYGFHPPTIYFPLIVHGAIMIEPTETECKEECDRFCDAMIAIAKECQETPDLVLNAPTTTYRRRLDEARAVKSPRVACLG